MQIYMYKYSFLQKGRSSKNLLAQQQIEKCKEFRNKNRRIKANICRGRDGAGSSVFVGTYG